MGVPLAPGDVVVLPGSGVGVGPLVYENTKEFEIFDAGGNVLLYAGTFRQRVILLDFTGTLSFEYRIVETNGSVNGLVMKLATRSFTEFYTDVDHLGTALGIAPVAADRSPSGSDITFSFEEPVFPGANSTWMQIGTDAVGFENGGRVAITLNTGESVELEAVQPAGGYEIGCRFIDFDDRRVGAEFPVGSTFVSNGVPIHVQEFYADVGSCTNPVLGEAEVVSEGPACGTGNEIWVNNTNLEFDYGVPLSAWKVDFGEYGGNVNLTVNGECASVPDFTDLPAVLGGVTVTAMHFGEPGQSCGSLLLEGFIEQVSIGGQELAIDNVSCEADPCFEDEEPPIAELDIPTDFACGCDPLMVEGTATDDNFESYTLAYRRAGTPTYTVFEVGGTPVTAGLLGVWNASGLPQGYYFLKLTVRDVCGNIATDETVVWLGTAFDNLTVRWPDNGDILGATICIDGTAWDNICFDSYVVEYQPAGGGSWSPVDPDNPIFTSTVINDPMAHWDTDDDGIPDGDYLIRVRAEDDCGNPAEAVRAVTVDNTPPVAEITQPEPCDAVVGVVEVIGTAFDDNLQSWSLQYTGGGSPGWNTIATGNTSVINDLLAEWDTTGLDPCPYTLRLVVTDRAVLDCNNALRHRTIYLVSVNVGEGICGDCDGDGDVDLDDWSDIETGFTGPGGP
jgi:hypothetical protein